MFLEGLYGQLELTTKAHNELAYLDSDAFVLVGDLDLHLLAIKISNNGNTQSTYIVDPDVFAPDVDSVQPTLVTSTNRHIVHFAVGTGVHGEVEQGRVHQRDVVNREVGHVVESQDPGAARRTLGMELIPVPLERTLGGTAEELKVGCVLNEDHVPTRGSGAVDDSIELDSTSGPFVESNPCLEGIVTRGDVHNTASRAVLPSS